MRSLSIKKGYNIIHTKINSYLPAALPKKKTSSRLHLTDMTVYSPTKLCPINQVQEWSQEGCAPCKAELENWSAVYLQFTSDSRVPSTSSTTNNLVVQPLHLHLAVQMLCIVFTRNDVYLLWKGVPMFKAQNKKKFTIKLVTILTPN